MAVAPLSPPADLEKESEKAALGPADAYLTGVRLLGLRSHSIAELTRKLRRRGYSEEASAAAVARLLEQRYLDDVEFARALVDRRTGSRGAAAIAAELKAKGISRAGVELALRDEPDEWGGAESGSPVEQDRGVGRRDAAGERGSRSERELAGAEKYARVWAARAELTGELDGWRALIEVAGPRLLRRGYSPAVVREACRRAVADLPVAD